MCAPVPREKDESSSCEFADEEFIGGFAEGRLYFHPLAIFEGIDFIDTASADDAQRRAHFDFIHGDGWYRVVGRFPLLSGCII